MSVEEVIVVQNRGQLGHRGQEAIMVGEEGASETSIATDDENMVLIYNTCIRYAIFIKQFVYLNSNIMIKSV